MAPCRRDDDSARGRRKRTHHRERPPGHTQVGAARRADCLDATATCTLAELLAETGDATYLQQLSGGQSGISSITGRISVGAMGFRLRGGEPVGRLPTISVATSLQALLSSVLMVADDQQAIPGSPVVASTVLCAPAWLERAP